MLASLPPSFIHPSALLLASLVSTARASTGLINTGYTFELSHVPRLHSNLSSRLSVLGADLTNSKDLAYTIHMKIGGQELPLMLDTGSSDLWVVSSDCSSNDCSKVPKYYSGLSSSLGHQNNSPPFQLSYLRGSVSGYVASETVSLGPFEVSPQIFALANQTTDLGLSSTNTSGILGLSFPMVSTIAGTFGTTILDNLFAHISESQRYFAFKLGRSEVTIAETGSNFPSSASTFSLAQLDDIYLNRTLEFHYIPVSRAGADNYDYWKIPLRYITINSTNIPLAHSLVSKSEDPIAVLDSGTSLILGPTSTVDAFWSAVGDSNVVRRNSGSNLWEVRCERAILVNIGLGLKDTGRDYALDPSDINWMNGGALDGWCTGGIQANDGVASGDWLFGAAFLRNVYVVHYGQNSTVNPQVALLSTTNAVDATTRFREQRKPDTFPPPVHFSGTLAGPTHHKKWLENVTAALCGFMGGVLLMLLTCIATNMLLKLKQRLKPRSAKVY